MRNTLEKTTYKLFVYILKFVPSILAIIQTTCLVLRYYNVIDIITVLSCVGGTSFISIGILYALAYIFRFCYLYKMPLYYVTLITGMLVLDTFIGFPISTLMMYRIYFSITGVFLISYIIYAYKNRNNPNTKVDYIKSLCERYSCSCSN